MIASRLAVLLAATALAASAAAPLPAQTAASTAAAPDDYTRAVAAGYKALMLCGALNAAEYAAASPARTVASVEANELKGIYREYDALLPGLTATRTARGVAVGWRDDMPPRFARAEGERGCRLLPIGAALTGAAEPPVFVRAGIKRDARWPADDSYRITAPRGALAASIGRAFDGSFGAGSNTTAVVVLGADGQIAGERYAAGFGPQTPQRSWSVAKSIAGTLIGAAQHRRLIEVMEPAPIPEWQKPGDPRRAITTDQLLRMASGLYSPTAGNRTDAVYFGGTSVTEETVAWPLGAPPGSAFRYANNDTMLAIRGLRAKLGKDDFARELLFARIGMASTIAEQDWQGNYILSSQLWSTPRDFARLGLFWLNDGVWQGTRILPEGWMRYMTTRSGPQPARGAGYGATLWLFGPDQGLPAGSYAAQGNRGQYIMVIPSRRIVVVRRGEDAGSARFDIAAFTADVLKALPAAR